MSLQGVAECEKDVLPTWAAVDLIDSRIKEHLRVALTKLPNIDLGKGFRRLIHSAQGLPEGVEAQAVVRLAIKMASGARRPRMAERREDGSPKGAETGQAGLGLRQPAPEGHARDLAVHCVRPNGIFREHHLYPFSQLAEPSEARHDLLDDFHTGCRRIAQPLHGLQRVVRLSQASAR